MKCNVGKTEKIIRVAVGLVAVYLGVVISPWFYLAAGIVLITAVIGFCPVTNLLGINVQNKKIRVIQRKCG